MHAIYEVVRHFAVNLVIPPLLYYRWFVTDVYCSLAVILCILWWQIWRHWLQYVSPSFNTDLWTKM